MGGTDQRSLSEGESTVQLTSLYCFISAPFCTENIYFLFKAWYLNKEVNRIEPSTQLVFLAQT
jgi:hypothetical protein